MSAALRAMVGLMIVGLTVGCIQWGEGRIDDARGGNAAAPQESVAGPDQPTPTTDATPPGDVVAEPSVPPGSTPTPEPAPMTAAPPPPPPPSSPSPATPPPPPPPSSPPPPPSPTPSPTPSSPPPPHPSPTPSPPPPATWPREGSAVSYQDFYATGSPDGSWYRQIWANATWRYSNGDWRGSCDAHVIEHWSFNDTTTDVMAHRVYDAAHPPHWPPLDTTHPPSVGQPVRTWFLDGCEISNVDFQVYAGTDSEGGTPTFVATDTHDGSPNDFRSEWRQDTGLVLVWDWWQRNSHHAGRVTSLT